MIYKISGSIALMLALLVLGAWNFHTTVRTERIFNASAADVWRVWNDPDSIRSGGPQGLLRTRRPERRARGWQLSLGDEICARQDVLEHRNLQGSRREQENRVNDVFF